MRRSKTSKQRWEHRVRQLRMSADERAWLARQPAAPPPSPPETPPAEQLTIDTTVALGSYTEYRRRLARGR